MCILPCHFNVNCEFNKEKIAHSWEYLQGNYNFLTFHLTFNIDYFTGVLTVCARNKTISTKHKIND